jgi:hypothetical protein
MKLKNKKYFEQTRWVKMDDVEFEIRPFPFSQHKKIEVMSMLKEQFMYCLVGWKNILDEKDKPVLCNEDNKLQVFDFYPEIRNFIISEATGVVVDVNEVVGNL